MKDKIFRFYFVDGSEELVTGENIVCALSHVVYIQNKQANSIVRIEEDKNV